MAERGARTPEHKRLEQARKGTATWKAWGPYLSERQWGTVREDTSDNGDAWASFPHDHARSRAYRWGEDGIAGISDDQQRLCLALALWNGADPILKERMFGLTNGEGNHGEDAKEYWFYLDSTPTHSYLKCQYKYPQRAFPYDDLLSTNRAREKTDPEYELLDTGIFADDRYFDVVVEYAKAAPDDILMLVTATNRGPDPATLHVLPTLWFRNTWSWADPTAKPSLHAAGGGVAVMHDELGQWTLACDAAAELLFCENETNNARLYGSANAGAYVKDGINDHVVGGHADAVNPARTGTKAAVDHVLEVAPGASARSACGSAPAPRRRRWAARSTACWTPAAPRPTRSTRRSSRRTWRPTRAGHAPGAGRDAVDQAVLRLRRPPLAARSRRQPVGRRVRAPGVRNASWFHMVAGDVISMPDTWEYPWFAAWDLAFHCAPLSLVDVDFAKEQIEVLLRTRYMHPNGQIPAYEWNFTDVNPPVTAWAALWVYEREAEIRGKGDRDFLARVFERLLTNFTWWVNRKDPDGRNLFQGGFLGLDNIGIFDRSAPLPGGGTLEQADGTAWMALYCQWMLQIALELGEQEAFFADMALKFVSHFAWIAVALDPPGPNPGLWDEEDGFYYDVMRMPDGQTFPLRVRSLVGLLPLCASTVITPSAAERDPQMLERTVAMVAHFADAGPGLEELPGPNADGLRLLSLVNEPRLRRILAAMLDEERVPRPARHPLDLAPPRRRAVRVRLGRPALHGRLPARRVRHRDVRRQLELARSGVVSDERPDPARAAAAASLLRRCAARRVPDRVGPADGPARGGHGDRPAPGHDVHPRRRRPAARLRRDGGLPDRPALARPDPVPRVLPRRQRRGDRGQPPDGLDRAGGHPPGPGALRRCACRRGRRSTRSTRRCG